jgi:diguanylate cyclase (GGDEF)-like protein
MSARVQIAADLSEASVERLTERARRARLLAYAFGATVLVGLLVWPFVERGMRESVAVTVDLALPLVLVGGAVGLAARSRRAHVAVERARHAITEEQSRRDELSGLYNLRYLRESAHTAIAEAARDGRAPLALISFDLDNFKDVNDRLGQTAGDAMLGAIGAALEASIDGRGIAARLAGDEFAVLVPGAGRQSAEQMASLIQATIAQASATASSNNAHLSITASFGIAVYPKDGADYEALAAASTRELHRMKSEKNAERLHTQERDSQDVFFAIGDAIGRSLAPSEAVKNFCRAVGDSLHLDMAGIWQIHDDDVIAMLTAHVSSPERAAASAQMASLNPITRGEAEALGLISRRPVYLDDAGTSPSMPDRYRPFMPPNTWLIAAPAGPTGFLVLSAAHERCAPPSNGLVEAIARLAASTVNNSQAYDHARERAEQLAALAGVGGLLFGEGSYEDKLGVIARRIVDVTRYDTLTIDTLDPANEQPFCRNVYGRDVFGREYDDEGVKVWRGMRPALTEPSIAEFLTQASRPIVMDDPVTQAPPDYRQILDEAGIRTVAVVPIVWRDELMGMMYFASYRPNGFGDEDLALMQSIASELAPSIQVQALNIALETSYADLKDAHLQALLRLAYAAEARDPYTECHLQRIRATAIAIAVRMGVEGTELEQLGYGAIVHDLGKLRIPDSILTNPGQLSDAEWTEMKKHPEWGAEIIGENAFYDVARQVALCHHERWDGSGYPRGLAGEAIPLAARIVAVADVYDALTTARPYKRAWAPERALVEIMRLRGKTLCPQSVDVFMELWREGEIARIDEATLEDSMETDFRSLFAAA